MSLTLEAEKWAEELTLAYMCSLQEHWQFYTLALALPSHLLSNVVGSPSLWTAFHHRCAPRFLALWTLSSIRSFGRLLGMTLTSKKNRGDHNKSGTTKPIRFLESFFLSESLKQPNPLPLVIVHTIFFRQKCVCQWLPPNPKEKKAKKTAATTTTTTTARLTHLQTFPPRFRMVVTVPFFWGDRLRMIPKQDGRSARSSWKHTVPWAFFFKFPERLGFGCGKTVRFFGKRICGSSFLAPFQFQQHHQI